MTKLILTRRWYTDKSTEGELQVPGKDGRFCYTLEPPWNEGQNRHNLDAIPPGTYPLVLAPSLHFRAILPLLVGVPGRDGILMHSLNDPSQTLGCIGVGFERQTDRIEASGPAIVGILELLLRCRDRHEDTEIMIVNGPPAEEEKTVIEFPAKGDDT